MKNGTNPRDQIEAMEFMSALYDVLSSNGNGQTKSADTVSSQTSMAISTTSKPCSSTPSATFSTNSTGAYIKNDGYQSRPFTAIFIAGFILLLFIQ
jgi:PKD repeat protein